MKNRKNNLIKTLLTFSIVFSFLSCEKDDLMGEVSNESSIQVSSTNLNEIKSNTVFEETIKTFENVLDVSKESSQYSKK